MAVALVLLLLVAGRLGTAAFYPATRQIRSISRRGYSSVRVATDDSLDSLFGPRVDDGEDVVLFADDDAGGESGDWGAPSTEAKKRGGMSRWESLNPKIKGEHISCTMFCKRVLSNY